MPSFDVLFVNGNILTMKGGRRVRAVAVHGGKVAAVGEESELKAGCSATTERIDLQGKTMLPGFEDAHAHIWKLGQLLTTSLDLRGATSIEQIGRQLQERDGVLPASSWLQGRGLNELLLAEGRLPQRADLDRFVPQRPVLLTRTCGHIFLANSAALRLAGIKRDTKAPAGGLIERDASGEPNGVLHETAVGLVNRVLPAPTRQEYRAMITAALQRQLSFGITASSDCGVLPGLLETYLEMDADGSLPARMTVMPLGKPDGMETTAAKFNRYHSPMLNVDTVKFLADGGLSGATAALSTPYRNSTSRGVTRFDTDELFAIFAEFHNLGWRICTHAIGDVAIEQVLSLYERLPRHAHQGRNRIEHLGLASRQQLKRMAKNGAIAVTQPIFLDELGGNFKVYVPDSLAAQVYPIRDMLAAGLTVAFSSDAPVVKNDAPLKGVEAAVLRRTADDERILPEQAISVEEALYAYTTAAAEAAGEEQTRGSIQPGRWADFAVLSADPVTVAPETIAQIHVEQTYLAGKLVYARTGN
jgi:hypothetical protein